MEKHPLFLRKYLGKFLPISIGLLYYTIKNIMEKIVEVCVGY